MGTVDHPGVTPAEESQWSTVISDHPSLPDGGGLVRAPVAAASAAAPMKWRGEKKQKVRTPVQAPSALFCMKDATERSPATADDVMAVL